MKENYTDITIVLDASGSMDSLQKDVIASVNKFVAEQAAVPGSAAITLFTFNTYVGQGGTVDIRSFRALDERSYRPMGGTALLDAMGTAIEATGRRLAALPEGRRPARVIVAVITDGEENSSRSYSRERVFEMIELQRATYSWDVLFLAANQDAIQAGMTYGIKAAASINYAHSGVGYSSALGALSDSVTRARLHPGESVTFDSTDAK